MLHECRLSAATVFGAVLAVAGAASAQEVKPFTTQLVTTTQSVTTQPVNSPQATSTTDAARAAAAVAAVEAARSGKAVKLHRETGMASFYRTHGKTASGLKSQGNMTAAHRRLPFGSRVRVKDMKTGKEVVVVITDRGPFKRSRVIDLSHAAAVALGITGRGVAKVEVLSE